MKHLILSLCLSLLPSISYAQPHEHGVGGLPDWYDPACCSQQDCRPLAEDELPAFFRSPDGEVWAEWKGMKFTQKQFKPSQDERYHVCFIPDDGEGYANPLCLYIPSGV